MIVLDDVTYWYPGASDAALRNVSLRFQPGEAACVMGRNGSGKTTLFKLIAGLSRPARGSVTVNGASGNDRDIPQVAILFQNPENQMVATMVDKEIAFALENQAMPPGDMQAVIDSAAERFGITHLLGRVTGELSGGETQRVALAAIMVNDPPVLLLDEPDAFLDEAGRGKLNDELVRLHRNRPHLVELRITQSKTVAADYKRLLVVDGGTIVYDGPPSAYFEKFASTGRVASETSGGTDEPSSLPEIFTSSEIPPGQRLAEAALEAVDFAYPGTKTPVLARVGLSLKSGSAIGLVGPTGVGKSTLSVLLCGLARPTSGKVIYRTASGAHLTADRVRGQIVAILQQPERQFFLETCAKEIAFGPANLGREVTDEQIADLLDWAGLPAARFARRDPFSLSAGEKRRLALAAVLALAPALVIFDEPTAGLDPDGVAWFIRLSDGLRQAGVGQMIISHDGNLIRRLTERVVYLRSGDSPVSASVDDFFRDARFKGVVSPPDVAR